VGAVRRNVAGKGRLWRALSVFLYFTGFFCLYPDILIVNDKNFLFLAFSAPILRCVKRNTYLCKIVRIPRRDYSK